MTIDFNVQPIFDDFSDSNKYYRILFKPGLAVQARELTQVQSILQSQIQKFGNHVFENGSVVLGGERFFENDLLSIKIEAQFGGTDVDVDSFVGKTVVGSISGTEAIVKAASGFVSTAEPDTFIVKITSGNAFQAGENIVWTEDILSGSATIQSSDPFGTSSIFSINEGFFYIDGFFVQCSAQSVVLDKYTSTVSKNIGLVVLESIVTSDDDENLLDPAQGSPNFAAPGADRYSIDLVLTSKDTTETVENFIEISRVEEGVLVFNQERTLYSELEKEFARRTFDESGNYTVRPFPVSFIDHVGSAKARPVISGGVITGFNITNPGTGFTSTPTVEIVGDGTGATATVVIDNDPLSENYQTISAINVVDGGTGYTVENTFVNISGDPNKYTVVLDKGKAYVKGFEFETTSPTYLSVDRARTTESADNLDVSLVYGNFVYVDNAFGVFDTTSYTSVELHNVDRATVAGSTTKIGSAKVRFLKYLSGTVGLSTAVYKLSLFDISIDSGKLFKDLESIVVRSGSTVLAGYDLNELSKVNGIPTGDAFILGSDTPSLVFPLNHAYIKELKDTNGDAQNDYTFQRTFSGVAFTAGQATIQTNNGLERFFGGAGAYADSIKDQYYHVVVTDVGTSAFTVGQVLRFNSPRTISGGTITPSTPQQLTFNVNTAVGFTGTIIATINANTQTEKIKSLQDYTHKVISSPNTTVGGKDSLEVSDIYNILAVYNTGTVDPTGQVTVDGSTGEVTSWGSITSYTDVSSTYLVDNGQRDEYYDHGNIILNGTAPGVTDYLVVVYNYFSHSGTGFIGVGSYSIPYEDIPSYTSPSNGVTYSLRDCVDFRPRRADGGTALNNAQIPDPDFTLNTDYQYYVGRIDKIIASAGKSFFVKQGTPSTIVKMPADDSNGMNLYIVEVPPYTSNLSELSITYVDNKRYTMRDIGKLERRIENIEYYTQLSLLEKQARDETINDATNLEKFKNGFFVDPFTTNDALYNGARPDAWSSQIWGWWNFRDSAQNTWNKNSGRIYSSSVSESTNPDYSAAIDPFKAELRAEAEVNSISFSTTDLSNTVQDGDLVTLGFSETNYISQQLASKTVNVNPYSVIAFVGEIKLDPPTDLWVDTKTLPAVNRVVETRLPDLAPVTRNILPNGRVVGETIPAPAFQLGIFGTGLFQTRQNQVTGPIASQNTVTNTNIIGQATSNLGSAVVDVQYLPFIRAKKIIGVCNKFKPKTRLYPFIEKDSIAQYCKPLTVVTLQNHTGDLFVQDEIVEFKTGGVLGTTVATGRVAVYSPGTVADPTKRLLSVHSVTGTIPTGVDTFAVGDNSNSAAIVSVTNYNTSDPLVPDEYGILAFEFNMPGGVFKTGERTVRLVDNIDNDASSAASVGETTYFALGTLQSTQQTLLTTRTVQSQRVTTIQRARPKDPLAQTFFVDPIQNPEGLFVSSLEFYFKTKSSTVPVSMEIRRTINGFPESVITSIPFGEVTLNPEDVNVSETGSVATKFSLPSPVHLGPGEYALVLISNSDEYEVFVAEMGKTDLITSQIISKQPYTGVFFKSQNASTWTPVQEEDIKFKINTAVFQSSGSVDFELNDNDTLTFTGTLTTGSAVVTGIADTSDLSVDDYAYGTGIPDGARITVVGDSSITLDSNATATGETSISVIPYIEYQTLHVNSSSITPPGTSLEWSVKLLDAATETLDTNFSSVRTNLDIDYPAMKAVVPGVENAGVGSIVLRATLSTQDSTLSPAVDAAGLSAIFAKNVINMTDISVSDAEEVSRGGDALCRYISKKITLADGFDASNIVVTLDAYKPAGTDVRVYYRTLPSEKNTSLNDESWVRMELGDLVGNSSSIEDFKEHKYYPQNYFDAFGVPSDDPISPRFNTWAIKIVLVSSNEATSPKVRDLRAIALDS